MQVNVDAVQVVRALHLELAAMPADLSAEALEYVADLIARLICVSRPPGHRHTAAGHRCRREERRSVGQVRFDADVARCDTSRPNDPTVGLGVVDLHPPGPQHGHRHLDVRQ
jgi:hypothetical protein